ncbi:MAG: cytochrome c biogenesis protein CcsA [Planctomycetales bacterium]
MRSIFSALILVALSVSPAWSAEGSAPAPKIDWSAWQSLPVLDDGRIKPLDTYAEEKVTLITGRSKWNEVDPQTGKTLRTYRAPELLYVWIALPDVWVKKPVIRCEYRPLRKIMLGEKLTEGTYVSLDDFLDWDASKKGEGVVFRSKDLQKRYEAIEQAARQSKSAADVGDNPEEKRINGKFGEFVRHVQEFLGVIDAHELLVVPGIDPRILTEQVDPNSGIAAWIPLGSLLKLDNWQQRGDVNIVALMAPDGMAMMQNIMDRGLYIRRKERDNNGRPKSDEDSLAQLTAALPLQSKVRPYLQEIKTSFDQTRTAYEQIGTKGPVEFERALRVFGTKVSDLAHELETARKSMGPIAKGPEGYIPLPLDEAQMALTAYPAVGSMKTEIHYNKLQPFYMACWFFGLASLPLLAAWILGLLREGLKGWGRFLYLVGMGVTAAAILFATYGFGLRIAIAGRPPVTNMYETVIWVSYVVSVLGLWFGILPLLWPGLEWSWRLSAFPFTWEAKPLTDEDRQKFLAGAMSILTPLVLAARVAGFAVVMMVLTQVAPLREYKSSFKIISLTPPITGENTVSFEALLTWGIGIATVLLAAWYVPRVIITLASSLVMVIPELRRKSAHAWEQVFSRQFFLIGSIPVALFGMVLAYQVGNLNPEILNPRIGSIAAVLNNNYWLTIHVLTIVSSYGAGALAWGLGNLAMLYYLFGSYRRAEVSPGAVDQTLAKMRAEGLMSRLKSAGKTLDPSHMKQAFTAGIDSFGSGDEHLERSTAKPPKDVQVLANFSYKVMQVAVLLLAAGTILGGLWADVSWGRFWDWDPKEVWALISLLAYLVFLHGRFAGWVGTFGTNAGSVLCFQAIMMSWYGVNFVLPQVYGWLKGTNMPSTVGMHSYATGAGGLEWVASACALNLLVVFLAWTRYTMETIVGSKQAPASKDAGAEATPPVVAHSN